MARRRTTAAPEAEQAGPPAAWFERTVRQHMLALNCHPPPPPGHNLVTPEQAEARALARWQRMTPQARERAALQEGPDR